VLKLPSLSVCSCSEKTELAFDNSHVWFKKFIDLWFQVAHKKALNRIAKAVEIDKVGPLEPVLLINKGTEFVSFEHYTSK
jgi:hypothetical protein